MDDSESSCRRRTGESFRSIAVFAQPGWSENVMPSTTIGGYLSNGLKGCQGTPWSDELDGKELYGAFGGEL